MIIKKNISIEQQTELTSISVRAGQLLHQHGAESRLIEQTTQRIGIALGADHIDLSVSADSIVISSRFKERCISATRHCNDRGINMHMVCDVQRICILLEKDLLDQEQVKTRLERLKPIKYNRWLMIFIVGLSCGSFSHFFGGDLSAYLMTFIASSIAMFVRQEMIQRHHNPFVNFALCAFVATSIASIGVIFDFGQKPQIAMAASVLLLVPGFPFINSISDILKGHVNMGIARWVLATLLTSSVAVGIAGAIAITGVRTF